MYAWFQNLNETGSRLAHFRGSLGRSWERKWFDYEFTTGPALRLTMSTGSSYGRKLSFGFGLIFCTLWLTVYGIRLPFLKPEREWGFYWYEWTLWMFCGRDPMSSSSKDPWYYQIVIHPLDILFGRTIHFETEVLKSYSPPRFEFRGKEFQMDGIQICDAYWFRPRIPFALWKRQVQRMHLEIKHPPGYAGKGENSWDCGDDASYGVTCPYKGPKPSWKNRDEVFEFCCRSYCEDVSKSIKRYGRASGDTLPHDEVGFKYLGPKRDPNEPQASAVQP